MASASMPPNGPAYRRSADRPISRARQMYQLASLCRYGLSFRESTRGTRPSNPPRFREREMRDVSMIGAGMIRFGKYLDTSMKVLGRDAVNNALASAGLEQKQLGAAA